MKKIQLKKTVEFKVMKSALKCLLLKIQFKWKEIKYGFTLECHVYLLPSNILTQEE